LKIASSSAFSCWPFATPVSLPPWALEAWSTEYCFATAFHDWPDSSARLASRLGLRLRQDDAQVTPLGRANFDLFLL
jgi:hypothetical protein